MPGALPRVSSPGEQDCFNALCWAPNPGGSWVVHPPWAPRAVGIPEVTTHYFLKRSISLNTADWIVKPPCPFSTGYNRGPHCWYGAMWLQEAAQHGVKGVNRLRRLESPPIHPLQQLPKWRRSSSAFGYACYWMGMQLLITGKLVIYVCMLLSVFFINSPRLTPDIARCSRKTTNVGRQLMASGRSEPGLVLPHPPLPKERTFPHVISFPSQGLWHRLTAGLRQTRTCLNMHCCYMINTSHECPKLHKTKRANDTTNPGVKTSTVCVHVACLQLLPVYVYSSVKLSPLLIP